MKKKKLTKKKVSSSPKASKKAKRSKNLVKKVVPETQEQRPIDAELVEEKDDSMALVPISKPASKPSTSLVRQDSLLQAYLKEVHRHPLLTREEETALAKKFQETGDREAFQKLVTGNLRFVVKISYEYVNYRLKLLDLIQEGNTGLVRAVKDFDPYKGVRLTTYAVWWIRSYIQDYILKNYSLVKMGTTQNQKKLFYRLRREQAKFAQQGYGAEESVKLLAASLDVKEKEVREMDSRMGYRDLSLNTPVGDDEKVEHIEILPSDDEGMVDSLGDEEQRQLFHKVLKEFALQLEGRDKEIFEKRLISEEPMTLKEIGEKYGVSKERARQLEEQIKKKLKAFVEEKLPDYNMM